MEQKCQSLELGGGHRRRSVEEDILVSASSPGNLGKLADVHDG